MDDDPAASVRKKKDSSLVRAAELVRDGKACAMVSAGNTGATMASALLRMGRLPGVVRPCIATPIPNPGSQPDGPRRRRRELRVHARDAGAVRPQMASTFVTRALRRRPPARRTALDRRGVDEGDPAGEGDPPTAAGTGHSTSSATSRAATSCPRPVDVVVTDGFTGNVALKTLEGALKFIFATVLAAVGTNDETRAAGDVLFEYLLPLAAELTPGESGRRDAAGPRRHLRDLPRVLQRDRHQERAARRLRDGRGECRRETTSRHPTCSGVIS